MYNKQLLNKSDRNPKVCISEPNIVSIYLNWTFGILGIAYLCLGILLLIKNPLVVKRYYIKIFVGVSFLPLIILLEDNILFFDSYTLLSDIIRTLFFYYGPIITLYYLTINTFKIKGDGQALNNYALINVM